MRVQQRRILRRLRTRWLRWASMIRYLLPRGRYVVHDGEWWILYDRPGYVLGNANDNDPESLERFQAFVIKYGG